MRHKEWKMRTMVERILGDPQTNGTKSDLKTYARGNNDAPSISKYGSLVWANTQIAALR